MKKYTLFFIACACACTMMLDGCKREQVTETVTEDSDTLVVSIKDSTLWGHLGVDTGMSALEFITDEGDTLELYRTDPYTGEDGKLTGEIRNFTDHFAITVSNDGETMRTAINATQLASKWKAENGSIDMHENGTISSEDLPYDGWKLWNGHILLSSQQQQEYGIINRVDTMDIVLLSRDSLVIYNQFGQKISFSKK